MQCLSCSKTVGWRVVCSKKISMALVFVFWVTFGGQLFELFARETNLKKQSSVQGPLDLKLLTLPLDHEMISEDRKKTFQGHCAV